MKLKPDTMVREATAGSAATRLSTRSMISMARSCDVPAGKVTEPISVPVSSCGTIPVGVMAMSMIKARILAPVMTKERTLCSMK